MQSLHFNTSLFAGATSHVSKAFTASLLAMFASSGCGPGSVPEYDAFECVDAQTLCVTLEVPSDYDGTPRELATIFYETSDTNGPPNDVLPAIEYPSISAGQTYELSHNQVEVVGEYYLMFVLYDEDGGTWVPEPGVDYTAKTNTTVLLDGGPLELGVMNFELAE